jgi:mannosyltransferase
MNDIMRRFLQGHVPWLFIAMAVGLMLRWYKLSGDLYADEIWITESVKLPFDAFLREVMDDWVHPPLFFFIVRGLGLLFGFHELSGRLVALVAGVLSIPLIAWIGSLSHSRKVGVIAAILLAISPIHIWHSQYGRHYSLFVFFVLLSTATFMKVWQDPRSRLWSSLYVLSSVVLVYTHNFGWLLILCQNVAFILFRFTTVKHWAALQVILGVCRTCFGMR